MEYDVRIKSLVGVPVSLTHSHTFLRRATPHLVECSGAHGSLLMVYEMGIDIPLVLVSSVNDSHISRNFALDT